MTKAYLMQTYKKKKIDHCKYYRETKKRRKKGTRKEQKRGVIKLQIPDYIQDIQDLLTSHNKNPILPSKPI